MTPVSDLKLIQLDQPISKRTGNNHFNCRVHGKGSDWMMEMIGHALINYFLIRERLIRDRATRTWENLCFK